MQEETDKCRKSCMKRKMGRESTFLLLESILLVSYWQVWASGIPAGDLSSET
jgi:hypothetical protein